VRQNVFPAYLFAVLSTIGLEFKAIAKIAAKIPEGYFCRI